MKFYKFLLYTFFIQLPVIFAAEIHSNGTGGGLWSNPSTWHSSKIPESNDIVIIAMRDTVTFDITGKEEPSCSGLMIDPEGVLTFKKMPGILTLTVKGNIRSYGTIRLEATSLEAGIQQLRIIPPAEITMLENSSLLVYGRQSSGKAAMNVRITASAETRITANDQCMIDIQNAVITDVVFNIYNLDNTGNTPNERINFIDCHLLGTSRIFMQGCDTPVIKNNSFECFSPAFDQPAVFLNYCSLAQVFNNTFRGYHSAIRAENDKDSIVSGNIAENCTFGIYWNSGKQAMLKHNKFVNCTNGVFINATEGLLEDIIVDTAQKPFSLNSLYMQMTDCSAQNTKTNHLLELNNASVTLLNCNIADDQILCKGKPPAGFFAENMQYVVAKVSGKIPAGTLTIAMETAKVSGGVPQGKADLNVRNSPAKISPDGWSPLPRTMRALTVRSWTMDANGKVNRPPFYDLIIFSTETGNQPKEIKRVLVEPQDKWYRADPDAMAATVEINL